MRREVKVIHGSTILYEIAREAMEEKGKEEARRKRKREEKQRKRMGEAARGGNVGWRWYEGFPSSTSVIEAHRAKLYDVQTGLAARSKYLICVNNF